MKLALVALALVLSYATPARAVSFHLLDVQLVAPDEGGGDTIVIFRDAPRAPIEPPPAKFACFWNFFIPGVGQAVLGKPLRGLLFFVGSWGLLFGSIFLAASLTPPGESGLSPAGLGVFLLGGGTGSIVWFWSMIDAWSLGEKIDGR